MFFLQSLLCDGLHKIQTAWQYFYPSWAPHIFTKLLHALGNFSCSIPRPTFARMKSDASKLEEVVRQEIMDITCPFQVLSSVDVVQKSEQIVDCHAKQKRRCIKGSPCSPPSCWQIFLRQPSSSSMVKMGPTMDFPEMFQVQSLKL